MSSKQPQPERTEPKRSMIPIPKHIRPDALPATPTSPNRPFSHSMWDQASSPVDGAPLNRPLWFPPPPSPVNGVFGLDEYELVLKQQREGGRDIVEREGEMNPTVNSSTSNPNTKFSIMSSKPPQPDATEPKRFTVGSAVRIEAPTRTYIPLTPLPASRSGARAQSPVSESGPRSESGEASAMAKMTVNVQKREKFGKDDGNAYMDGLVEAKRTFGVCEPNLREDSPAFMEGFTDMRDCILGKVRGWPYVKHHSWILVMRNMAYKKVDIGVAGPRYLRWRKTEKEWGLDLPFSPVGSGEASAMAGKSNFSEEKDGVRETKDKGRRKIAELLMDLTWSDIEHPDSGEREGEVGVATLKEETGEMSIGMGEDDDLELETTQVGGVEDADTDERKAAGEQMDEVSTQQKVSKPETVVIGAARRFGSTTGPSPFAGLQQHSTPLFRMAAPLPEKESIVANSTLRTDGVALFGGVEEYDTKGFWVDHPIKIAEIRSLHKIPVGPAYADSHKKLLKTLEARILGLQNALDAKEDTESKVPELQKKIQDLESKIRGLEWKVEELPEKDNKIEKLQRQLEVLEWRLERKTSDDFEIALRMNPMMKVQLRDKDEEIRKLKREVEGRDRVLSIMESLDLGTAEPY